MTPVKFELQWSDIFCSKWPERILELQAPIFLYIFSHRGTWWFQASPQYFCSAMLLYFGLQHLLVWVSCRGSISELFFVSLYCCMVPFHGSALSQSMAPSPSRFFVPCPLLSVPPPKFINIARHGFQPSISFSYLARERCRRRVKQNPCYRLVSRVMGSVIPLHSPHSGLASTPMYYWLG